MSFLTSRLSFLGLLVLALSSLQLDAQVSLNHLSHRFQIILAVQTVRNELKDNILCFILCGIGGMLVICCLTVLNSIDQADTKETLTKSGGFVCPFVPFLPVASVLINTYLLLNIGAQTWLRVFIWLAVGVIIYIFYGRGHSLLLDDVRRAITHTDDDHADATLISCIDSVQ